MRPGEDDQRSLGLLDGLHGGIGIGKMEANDHALATSFQHDRRMGNMRLAIPCADYNREGMRAGRFDQMIGIVFVKDAVRMHEVTPCGRRGRDGH